MNILDKNLWLGKRKFSDRPIDQHNDIFEKAIQLVNNWENRQTVEVLEKNENISNEEKQEVIEKNSRYKAEKMDFASEQFKQQNSRLSNRIK